jgi:hypothetical protein
MTGTKKPLAKVAIVAIVSGLQIPVGNVADSYILALGLDGVNKNSIDKNDFKDVFGVRQVALKSAIDGVFG